MSVVTSLLMRRGVSPARVIRKIRTLWSLCAACSSWPFLLLRARNLAGRTRGRTGKRVSIAFREGATLTIRDWTHDLPTAYEIFIKRVYLPRGWTINPTDTVVDIGAHIGCFSVFAARRAWRGRVIAVEPDPANYLLLEENVRNNRLHHVVLLQGALAERCGEAFLYRSPTSSTGHTLTERAGYPRIRVAAVCLPALFARFSIGTCQLLKLDCEGCEEASLASEPSLLSRVERIVLEYHSGREAVSRLLRSAGFSVVTRAAADRSLGMLYAQRDVIGRAGDAPARCHR